MISLLIPYAGDGGHRDRLFDWTLRWWTQLLPDADIQIGGSNPPFNRARARNQAFARSTGDAVIVADADTIPTAQGVYEGLAALEAGAPWVIPYEVNRYYNLTQDRTEEILAGGTCPEPEPGQWEHKITSWAGTIMMPRDAYLAAAGYDERFNGWGYEDNAFMLALDRLAGRHQRIDTFICHLWHPSPEAECFGQPHIDENRALYRRYEKASRRAHAMHMLVAEHGSLWKANA